MGQTYASLTGNYVREDKKVVNSFGTSPNFLRPVPRKPKPLSQAKDQPPDPDHRSFGNERPGNVSSLPQHRDLSVVSSALVVGFKLGDVTVKDHVASIF